MSRIVLYRQYWMATMKEWHFATSVVTAENLEFGNGVMQSVDWVCDSHLGTIGLGVHFFGLRVKHTRSIRDQPVGSL
jgi:hypothetical protein